MRHNNLTQAGINCVPHASIDRKERSNSDGNWGKLARKRENQILLPGYFFALLRCEALFACRRRLYIFKVFVFVEYHRLRD